MNASHGPKPRLSSDCFGYSAPGVSTREKLDNAAVGWLRQFDSVERDHALMIARERRRAKAVARKPERMAARGHDVTELRASTDDGDAARCGARCRDGRSVHHHLVFGAGVRRCCFQEHRARRALTERDGGGAPLRLFIVVARPFFVALEGSNAVVLRLFGIRPRHEAGVTQAEIRRTLTEGLDTGALLGSKRTMMDRVLDLEQRSLRTIMTGRRAVEAIRENTVLETIRQTVMTATASRRLVLAATRDKPVGIVLRADLLALVSPIHYVADSASVLGALGSLKAYAAGVPVAADEYGSMLGIVTFVDVSRRSLATFLPPISARATARRSASAARSTAASSCSARSRLTT